MLHTEPQAAADMTALSQPLPDGVDVASVLLRSATDRRRSWIDRIYRSMAFVAAVLCVVPLVAIVVFVTINGASALSIELLTRPSRALGLGGGAAAAILGSLQMVPLAALIGTPIGVLAGIYVVEFSANRSASIIRFAADVLVGVPSILVGVFAFTILVLPFHQFNAFAGSVALAIIIVPVVMRTTEESLRLVPGTLREASLALGVPVWRTALSVVLRTGLSGVLGGVMLAIARAAGEAAPLIFTALGNQLINVGGLGKPMDALPLFIYVNARQPYPAQNSQAWGAALLLLLFVLVVNVVVRGRSLRQRAS
jgi:phosphate transport system permease protein